MTPSATQSRRNTCRFDLLDVEADFAYRAAADGLLEPLDHSIVDPAQVDPEFAFEYGAACFQFSLVLAYNRGGAPAPGAGMLGRPVGYAPLSRPAGALPRAEPRVRWRPP